MGKVRKVAKIPMSVLSKDAILCLTSESDDEVEETRVKETTFPEIEDNDTPVTEQDSLTWVTSLHHHHLYHH
uniref:Uncharacterized protein n=1 Tax=Magallana gigas TaxID=29159 RepID=A0A8W8P226_MAGGI